MRNGRHHGSNDFLFNCNPPKSASPHNLLSPHKQHHFPPRHQHQHRHLSQRASSCQSDDYISQYINISDDQKTIYQPPSSKSIIMSTSLQRFLSSFAISFAFSRILFASAISRARDHFSRNLWSKKHNLLQKWLKMFWRIIICFRVLRAS